MDLEVVGRHALLFDDDATAAFINSSDALVEWNSLSIDRYDVRHLLSAPLPPRKPRRQHTDDASLELKLDQERYLDLPSPSDDEQEQGLQDGAKQVDAGGYNAVAFSYGNKNEFVEEKNNDSESGFCPSFQVPESLLQNLPPTEKLHQIIARTAMFVSNHGGQSEIVLRVKQGDNPTFGFLMPNHHLHAYFRFLVDHPELIKPDSDRIFPVEKNNADGGLDQSGGALSILGSVYGSGEDEDGATEDVPESERNPSEAVDVGNATVSHGLEQAESFVDVSGKEEVSVKGSISILKQKAPIIKRNRFIGAVGNTSGSKKEGDALNASVDKSLASLLSKSAVELPVLEPPSDLKRVVEKIIEFILRNGDEFEAVLAEQDRKHGRFPFLLPSNPYHPYYSNALKKAKESKFPGKSSVSEKHDSIGHGMGKTTALSKEGDATSGGSTDPDIPYSYDKKDKFKMVLGKSKKDGHDPPSKAIELQIDAAATAAILQAATRGIKTPSLEFFPKTSLNGNGRVPSTEGGHTSSFGSLQSSQHRSSISKLYQKGEGSVSVPVAKAIAETAAITAAGEADSSEVCLTREQKLKTERLKRAKMFAAMLKNGAAPLKTEPLRALSAEPSGSGISGSGAEFGDPGGKEREGSSVPMDVDTSDKSNEKSEKKISGAECNNRRSKRSYRSRSKRHDEEEEDGEEEEEEEEIEEDKRDHKHSRRKHRTHRTSHRSRDRHKHSKRHSSSEETISRRQDKYDGSLDDKHRHSHRHKYDSTSDSEHRRTRHSHKHDSTDDEHRHSRRRKHHISNDEHGHRSRLVEYQKSQSEKEADLEEGEILAKSYQSKTNQGDGSSRETSVELSKSNHNGRASSQPSGTTEVSDDLRAKIRAMLMATL